MTGTSTVEPPIAESLAPQYWSRAEWFYMWTKGLDPWRIAVLCRVPHRKVYEHIRGKVTYKPELFGQRLMLHDQPALPPGGLPKSNPLWEDRIADLAEFRRLHGRFPRQYVEGEGPLYSFVQNQRKRYRAGTLPESHKEYLDKKLPGWLTLPKVERERRLWEQRAAQLEEFVRDQDRYPHNSRAADPSERSLAVWLGRQRNCQRSGGMDVQRLRTLNKHVPGWWSIPTVRT